MTSSNPLYASAFVCNTFRSVWKVMTNWHISKKVLSMQILFTGFEALSIILFSGLAIGSIIIIYFLGLLSQLGADQLMYKILIVIITRELGPILTAFIIIARSGTAIATELGTMVAHHEIEAYIATGIDPMTYLVAPRFLGVTFSLFLLNIYFNFAGLIGSFFVSYLFTDITFHDYFTNVTSVLKASDLILSAVKSLVFGIIISLVSTYNGLRVENALTEIPQVAIKAVSVSFMLCIVVNLMMTFYSYF
ncbi:MAG: ABC transporter permease [Spirochaetia bacterium]|nr:ABC transporter permease [Spirochaetia bacterium]